jgi:hypothetical protein
MAKSWGKLHNMEVLNTYAGPNIVRVMKSRKMRLAGHVARMKKTRNAYKIN